MKITNGGWKKRGATKIINFDEKIDGGRGGHAMVESKRCVEWLEKSWADDFHLEEDGWGDDESGSRGPMRVITWKWEKGRAENGKTVIVEREGNWGRRRWMGCWEGQKCNKEQVRKCTSPQPPTPRTARTTLTWCSISYLKCCFSTLKWCVGRHGGQETVEPAGLILIALIEWQPWSTLSEPV